MVRELDPSSEIGTKASHLINVSKVDIHTSALEEVGVEVLGVGEESILEERVGLYFSASA